MSEIYGYCRVSSKDQNEARQMVAMKEVGVAISHTFVDKRSGKDFDRPQYKKLIKKLKKDDLVYVQSIDRLGRNYEEIRNQWKVITKDKEADICVLNMPILDTRREKSLLGTFIADLVLALMSFIAESERQNIRERQAAGIAAAKARGVHFGRRPKPLPENFCEVCSKVKDGRLSIMEGAKACEMPYSTFRDKIREYGETSVS